VPRWVFIPWRQISISELLQIICYRFNKPLLHCDIGGSHGYVCEGTVFGVMPLCSFVERTVVWEEHYLSISGLKSAEKQEVYQKI